MWATAVRAGVGVGARVGSIVDGGLTDSVGVLTLEARGVGV
ncbi:MAG: hypothetical protein ABSD96_17845 [Candidatus Korobacteraceae bacterium]